MANIAERLMTAIGAGGAAFISAFNERNLVPSPTLDWDSYLARIFRYDYSTHYYQNTIYSAINRYAVQLKSRRGLYKFTRGIYNPVHRQVEIYVAKCYGGSLDYENLNKGAIAIIQADDTLRDAIRQIWIWSNWATAKNLYVRNGAMKGDTAIQIVDDPVARKVRMEILDPAKIKEVAMDDVGNIKSIVIEYQVQEETQTSGTDTLQAKYHTFRQEIDEYEFRYYKNGQPFAYPENVDANGTPQARWANPYGFVPVAKAQHMDLGFMWGANAWNGTAGKVDEINDAASLKNDAIRKAVNVVWYYAGVQAKTELVTAVDEKDKIPAIYGPAGSQPFPMVAQIDIAAAIANVEQMLKELERDMPELALYQGSTRAITATEIEATHGDALDRINEARGNYNDVQVRAMQMAISIGALRRYDNCTAFSLASYAAGNLEHYIGDRPVVSDSLAKADKITNLIAIGVPWQAVAGEMDYSEDQIAEWEDLKAQESAAQDAALQAQIDAMANQSDANGNPPMDNQNTGADNMPMMDGAPQMTSGGGATASQ